jgi:hypothetical protein
VNSYNLWFDGECEICAKNHFRFKMNLKKFILKNFNILRIFNAKMNIKKKNRSTGCKKNDFFHFLSLSAAVVGQLFLQQKSLTTTAAHPCCCIYLFLLQRDNLI